MTLSGHSRTLGAIAAALLIAGCGSSSAASASHPSRSASASGSIGSSLISRAADLSGAAKGEKIAYTLSETVPSLGKITVNGTGAFNDSPSDGQMTLDVAVPGASSLGAEASLLSNLQLSLVIDQQAFYIKLPSNLTTLASSLTGGKQWLELDLTKLASSSKIPGLSSLLNGQGSPADPAATFQQIEAASANGVTKIGSATINGVATTEYRADLDLSKLSSSLPASLRAAMKQHLAQAEKTMGISSLPIDVYIDSANLIRRVVLNFTPSAGGTKIPISLQMDFLSYGPQPAPTVPTAAETFNVDSLLSKFGSGAAGSASGLFGG
jgi:hypothetical protein